MAKIILYKVAFIGVQRDIMVSIISEKKHELHIFFLCDCSGSMAGERIAAVNSAIERTVSILAEESENSPGVGFYINVIRFANRAEWHYRATDPLPKISWQPLIETGGVTALGNACELLATYLGELQCQPRQLAPVILLLSDGKPTDDAGAGLKCLLGNKLGREASRFAVGVGHEANGEILLRMTGQKVAQTAMKTRVVDLKNIAASFVLSGVSVALSQVLSDRERVSYGRSGLSGVA